MKRMTLEDFQAIAKREGIDFHGFCAKLARYHFEALPHGDEVDLVRRFFAITDKLSYEEAQIVSRVLAASGRAHHKAGWDAGVVAAGGDVKAVEASEKKRTQRDIARIEKERLERAKAKK